MDISWTWRHVAHALARRLVLARWWTSVPGELKKATDGERGAKIGMPVHTRQEQDVNAWKLRM